MKVALAAFLFVAFTSASAQNPFGPLPSACGPKDASFNVKLDKSQHSLVRPEPGKARIYFIHDSGAATGVFNLADPMMLGVDGVWVGANHGNSYFSVSVDPGEHHMCASSWFSREAKLVVLAHLQAESGGTYFYRTRIVKLRDTQYLEIDPVDSDEGKYLIDSYPLSISHPKN
jgi:hypothetical protein